MALPHETREADEAARYLRDIEARFVALRGRGFALSARDVGRVLAWRSGGVPLRVALGVIEEAMRRWRADGARRTPTLGGLERSVQAAMKRRAERLVTTAVASEPAQAGGDEWSRLRGAIEAAGTAQDDARARSILRRAWATLKREEAAGGDAWATAARLDAELVEAAMALLDEADRAAMSQAARTGTERAGGLMSLAARAERMRFEEARWTRARFGLPDLVGELLA